MASNEVVKALAVCAELCGANLSEGAARVIVAELEGEQEPDVLAGLTRMRREHDGRFSLAAVLRFIKDARRDRLVSQKTCWVCGAPALGPHSACATHLDTDRQWDARRVGSLVPTALIPRASK